MARKATLSGAFSAGFSAIAKGGEVMAMLCVLVALVALIAVTGCAKPKPRWVPANIPTVANPEECHTCHGAEHG